MCTHVPGWFVHTHAYRSCLLKFIHTHTHTHTHSSLFRSSSLTQWFEWSKSSWCLGRRLMAGLNGFGHPFYLERQVSQPVKDPTSIVAIWHLYSSSHSLHPAAAAAVSRHQLLLRGTLCTRCSKCWERDDIFAIAFILFCISSHTVPLWVDWAIVGNVAGLLYGNIEFYDFLHLCVEFPFISQALMYEISCV